MIEVMSAAAEQQPTRTIFINPANPSRKALADAVVRPPGRLEVSA